jgi:hypothetical protein
MGYPSGAVPVTNFLGTTGAADTFATHLDWLGKGGHRTVANIAERNAITTDRRSFGMLVSVNADPTPANNKTYQLCNVAMGGTNDLLTPLVDSNLNWREFATGSNFNFTGAPKILYSNPANGQITDTTYTTTRLLDSFTGADFDAKLRYACLNAEDGTIIDCTKYEGTTQVLSATIDITKSIKLIFPAMTVQYTSTSVTDHMFHIKKNNVFIQGTGRSSKLDQVVAGANTQFHMFTPAGATSNGGYHVTNINEDVTTNQDGYNVITLIGFDCIGIEQIYTTSGAPNYTIVTQTYGVGGICIIEGNPFVTGGGNAVNQIYIENIFVWKTRDHGILLIGAILAQVINCRVSRAAGHGFYLGGTATSITPADPNVLTLGGSTSSYFLNCYASSGRLAGFCVHSSSYSQLQNCAAENFGMGYLLRSAFNISLFGCGAEENNPSDNIPVNMNISFQSFENGILYTSKLNDIGGADLKDNYKGTSLYINGGRNLYIPNFFSTEPGGYNPGANPGSSRTTHITILGNTRAVYLTNPRLTGQSRVVNPIRIERFPQIGGDSPRDVNLFFNPTDDRPDDGTIWYSSAPNFVFTRSGATTSCTGIIMDQGLNTEVKNGATFYRPFIYTPDSGYTVSNPFKSILGLDNGNKILPLTSILVSETIYIPIPSYGGAGTIYVSPVGISTTSPDSNLLALCPPGQNKKILAFSLMASLAVSDPETITVSSYTALEENLLKTFSDGDTFPANVTLTVPSSIDAPWAIKIVSSGYGGTFKSIALAVINY